MIDMTTTVVPKSDQLNSDDLQASPRTIKITKVAADTSSAEQPIAIYFEGDNGKPYKPCKSMRRVMIHCWGKDGTKYTGRSMTLYRDPKVQFGGLAVGGIRISHMTDIDGEQTMALTATRASRKPFTVKPLVLADKPASSTIDVSKILHGYGNTVRQDTLDALEGLRADVWQKVTAEQRTALKAASEAAKKRLGEMAVDEGAADDAAFRGEQDETL